MKTKEFEWDDELVIKFTEGLGHNSVINRIKEFKKQHTKKQYPEGIVAFRSKPNGAVIYKKQLSGIFQSGTGHSGTEASLSMLINNDGYEIYTVKNSKGEEFSIGDLTHNGKTLKFEIVENRIVCITDTGELPTSIEFLYKAKTPLFTTEDGQYVYEGDRYWTVTSAFNLCDSVIATEVPYGLNRKFFIKIENARDWIEENKPKFSYRQIMDALNSVDLKSFEARPAFIKKLGIK